MEEEKARQSQGTRHTHDGYAIGVTERGTQTFTCQAAPRLSPPGSFSLINSNEPHDGRFATGQGWIRLDVTK